MKRRKKREGRPLKRSALLLLAALTMAALFAGCSQWKRYLDTSHARHERAPSTVSEKQIARTIAGVRPVKGNPDSHYQLALHYQTRGKYHEALREFKKTVAIDPRHVDALNGMGVSYDKLEHYGRAQKVYRAALRIKPDAPGILNNLGYSMYLQGNFAEALTILEKALALDGDNRRYRNNLARVRFETGDFEGALAEYTRGLGEAEAHVHMGASYYRIGMYGKAASYFSDALRIDPLVKGAKGGLRAARSLADISEPVAAAKEATSIEPGAKAVQALPDAPVRAEGTAEAESAPASMEEAALAAAVAAEKIEAVVSSTQAPVLAGSLVGAERVAAVTEETDLVGSAAVKGIEAIVRSSEVSARESVPLVASGAAGAERSPEAPRFAGSLFEAERVPAVAEETDLVGSAAVKGIETIVSSSEASAEDSATLVATGAAEAERPPEAPRFAGSLVEAERVPPAEETVPAGAEELGVLVSSSEASAEESATLVAIGAAEVKPSPEAPVFTGSPVEAERVPAGTEEKVLDGAALAEEMKALVRSSETSAGESASPIATVAAEVERAPVPVTTPASMATAVVPEGEVSGKGKEYPSAMLFSAEAAVAAEGGPDPVEFSSLTGQQNYVLARCHIKEENGTRITVLKYMDVESYMESLEIEIVNKSGDGSFSGAVSRYLRGEGYRKVAVLDAGRERALKTKVYYHADYLQPAFRVAGDIPGYQDMEKVESFSSSRAKVRIVIGEDLIRYSAVLSDRQKYALSALP